MTADTLEQALAEARPAIRAAISDAYYESRNAGRTMEQAADAAADAALAALPEPHRQAWANGLALERFIAAIPKNSRGEWSLTMTGADSGLRGIHSGTLSGVVHTPSLPDAIAAALGGPEDD